MEFLPLSRRLSSARNVPSGEERGETDVFAGYGILSEEGNECEARDERGSFMLYFSPPLVSRFALVLRFVQNAAFASLGS